MPVLIMLTAWDSPKTSNAPEYWYRSGVAVYSDQYAGNFVRILKADDIIEEMPAIGGYVGKEKEKLRPCYLKVVGAWRYPDLDYPNLFHIKFYGEYLECSSSDFIQRLRTLGVRDLEQGKLLFIIDDNLWDQIRKTLKLTPPQWWDQLRIQCKRYFQRILKDP